MVTVGVANFILHPPIGLTRTIEVEGSPFSGEGSLPSPQSGLFGSAYGLVWHVEDPPTHIGRLDGWITTYETGGAFGGGRIFQIAVDHDLLFLSGHITTQLVESNKQDGFFWFEESLPSAVHFWIFPGCEVSLKWMVL